MINVIPLIAKKYNRKGDTSGSLKSLISDLNCVTDNDDVLLFLSSIPRETKYSLDDAFDIIVSDDTYSNIFRATLVFLNIDLDYHRLLLNAIKSESYTIICMINKAIPTPDLFLAKNNYECLTIALDKSYAVFDKVLGMVIGQIKHTASSHEGRALGIFMTICILNKDIDKLASLCTGYLATCRSEYMVKDLMNKSAMDAFQYMSEEDIHTVVDDINSRTVLSRYLNKM
jgi:hypothetical protein